MGTIPAKAAGRVSRIRCLSFGYLFSEAEEPLKGEFPAVPVQMLDIRRLVTSPASLLRYLLQKSEVNAAYISSLRTAYALDAIALLLYFSRADKRMIIDAQGEKKILAARDGFIHLRNAIVDIASLPLLCVLLPWRFFRLGRDSNRRPVLRAESVLYLRTDPGYELKAGGSVAHTVGVIKGLLAQHLRVTYWGSLRLPSLEPLGIPIHYEYQGRWLRNVPELFNVGYSEQLYSVLRDRVASSLPDLIYQRYSLFNYTGALLAGRNGIPFILEFNGSEVWIGRNWGTPLLFERIARKIELANLHAADLIVVVSEPIRQGLRALGIPAAKILVNPNGVDPVQYFPEIDGSPVRRRCGIEGEIVIGFIGTFGKWHGAEVLASAAVQVSERSRNVHFLFIGDGLTMPDVRKIVSDAGITHSVTFTGVIPQKEAPAYLAACDILVAPHVPNPDGTPFFGSPTKLFEYMAMGKGIVASDLDQIGEVLAHEHTALLVHPGNSAALADSIARLVRDKELRVCLGRNARQEVLAKYTWTRHVTRIIDAFNALAQ